MKSTIQEHILRALNGFRRQAEIDLRKAVQNEVYGTACEKAAFKGGIELAIEIMKVAKE